MDVGEVVGGNELARGALAQLAEDLTRLFDAAGPRIGLTELRQEKRRAGREGHRVLQLCNFRSVLPMEDQGPTKDGVATRRGGVYPEFAPRFLNRLLDTAGAKQSGGNIGLSHQGIKLVGQTYLTNGIVVPFL